MQFTPKTEKEIAEDGLFPPGVYPFEIIGAENKISKKGNEMIELRLRVFHGSEQTLIHDYLLESIAHKLRHAAERLGLIREYNEGALDAADFHGKSGWAKISIQPDKTGAYPDRNTVVDYVVEPVSKSEAEHIKSKANGYAPLEKAKDADGDEIPF